MSAKPTLPPLTKILCSCGREMERHITPFGFDDNYTLASGPGPECHLAPFQVFENWIKQDRAQVRRAALLEAAKAVCPKCRDGSIPSKRCISNPEKFSDFWHRETDIFGIHSDSFCKASPIHALLAQEQERARGEGGER